MQYDFESMLTSGEMSKVLGIDRRTLLSWTRNEFIPFYRNPANGYYYFIKKEVVKALGLENVTANAIDASDQIE